MVYRTGELVILVVLLAGLVAASELGYRFGVRRSRSTMHDFTRTQVSNIQGTLLGLFALLMGFTFAMALSRFDDRRQMIVTEANAIGTAALRAQLLPSGSEELREVFRRYVAVRLEATTIPSIR